MSTTFKPTTTQVKTLNQILNTDDVITRFRLLQLWTIDLYTQSLGSVNAKQIVDVLTTSELSETSPAESIYSTLNTCKRNIVEINEKLKTLHEQLKHQQFVNSLLCRVFDEEEEDKYADELLKLQQIIDKNQQRIEKIQDLSESKINYMMKTTPAAVAAS